jgi:transaldolase
MPASWRPSRGQGYELDEILALAGTDRMTIPAPLLEKLAACEEEVPRKLEPESAAVSDEPLIGNGMIEEKEFRFLMTMDTCGNDKLAEGLRAFVEETEKLDQVIRGRIRDFQK